MTDDDLRAAGLAVYCSCTTCRCAAAVPGLLDRLHAAEALAAALADRCEGQAEALRVAAEVPTPTQVRWLRAERVRLRRALALVARSRGGQVPVRREPVPGMRVVVEHLVSVGLVARRALDGQDVEDLGEGLGCP